MQGYKRVKFSCYLTNITMAVVANLSPLLFVTFNKAYGISYTALGLLIVLNFSTQLTVDLLFSFFSDKLNPHIAVKVTPILSFIGLAVYASSPFIFGESVYVGLVVGTVIASAASGLAEVLTSPLIAAMPSDNPDSEMSKLHSVYAWGVVGVIIASSIFFYFLGTERWYILVAIYLLIPVVSTLLFIGCRLPEMQSGGEARRSGATPIFKRGILWLCVFAIFLGGATELAMAQWASSYLESAVGIPKVWGDIFGAALFAMMMGIGRTLYTKYGKNIERTLLLSGVGATVCYLIAAVSPFATLTLAACAMTGLFSAMLWPGSLIVVSDKVRDGGVIIYALMAAGGDLGASIAPQLVGAITDFVAAAGFSEGLCSALDITPHALGMKAGMLTAMLFPAISIIVFAKVYKMRKRDSEISLN